MSGFEEQAYPVFELFSRQWALVTAGTAERFNSCTVAWGSMGTLWTRPGSTGAVMTVYLHPARYTRDVMLDSEYFTVSFFPQSCKKVLGVMGSLSGRDTDKAAAAGLTPVEIGDCMGYREASRTFLCRKLYQHAFSKDDLAPEIQAYYQANPKSFPPDESGEWQPHWMFIGEIVRVVE